MANVKLTPPVVTPIDNYNTNATKVSTGYTHIGGTSKEEPVFNDGYVNLNINNNNVKYDGVSIPENFAMQIKGRNFQTDTKIVDLSNIDKNNIDIGLWYYGDYVALIVAPGYFIYSNKLTEVPTENQDVTIYVKRIDNLYHIEYKIS